MFCTPYRTGIANHSAMPPLCAAVSTLSRLLFSTLLMSVVAGCGGSSSPTTPSPAPASTTFQGTIAGSGNQSGTLNVTIQSQVAAVRPLLHLTLVATLHAQSVSASGSVHVAGGNTTSLTGTFDTATKAVRLSGGGFAFSGSASGPVVTGTYTAPGGASGAFATRSTASGAVTSYCGNVFGSGASSNEVTGIFNFTVSEASGALSGTFTIGADNPPTIGTLTGQVSGTAVIITFTATAGRFAGESGTIAGTIQGGTFSGTSATGNPVSGSPGRCQ